MKIDREIGGTNAEMPEAKDEPRQDQTSEIEEIFEPWKPKVRKSGTGCVYQINDHLWKGSYFPRLPDGSRKKFNVYAKTREECEAELAKMIEQKKKEITELKKKRRRHNAQRADHERSPLKNCVGGSKEEGGRGIM